MASSRASTTPRTMLAMAVLTSGLALLSPSTTAARMSSALCRAGAQKLLSFGRIVFGHVPGGLELPISLQQQQQQQQQLVRPPSLWRRRGATVRATTTKGGGRAPALTSLAVSQAVLSCRAAQSTSLTAATTIATLVWSVKAARWVG